MQLRADLEVSKIYDVIIIGAGPCGLATAARLRETHPSALFTDEEQARYSWINRNSRLTSVKNYKNGKVKSTSKTSRELDMLVLDSTSASWMTRWNSLFEKLEIQYLRSPMFFHPDPQDRDALLASCNRHEGEELCVQEIAGCVGKEVSKHKKKRKACGKKCPTEVNERERRDYFAPSTKAFARFCTECVERYNLHSMVEQGSVETLDYDFIPGIGLDQRLFTLRTKSKTYLARTVVLAIGGGTPEIPAPFPLSPHPGFSHALQLTSHKAIVPLRIRRLIQTHQPSTVLVIGGGLTSAQVADNLLRRGVSKVYLALRGPLKIKPFDVDLAWMGKWRNTQKAAFWTTEDMQERLEMAKAARGGGSVTPRYAKILRTWMSQGKLEVCTHTKIIGQAWDDESEKWTIGTEPPVVDMPAIDYVVYATGLSSNVETMPLLRSINDKYAIESFGGLPAVTDDLMWRNDVPLFVTGKLAMLQVGPGAGNLEGARLCAERVAWGVMNTLDEIRGGETGCGVGRGCAETFDSHERYVMGVGSKFDGLAIEA